MDPVNDPPTASNFNFVLPEDTTNTTQQTINFVNFIGDVDNTLNSLAIYIKTPVNSPIGTLVSETTLSLSIR